MTYANFNIAVPKKDLPLFRRLSKKMGWEANEVAEPNAETLAAFHEIESGAELETLDVDNFMDFVAAL